MENTSKLLNGDCLEVLKTLEGFNFIGIELDPEYIKIAEARIKAWEKEPEQLSI